MISSIIFVVLLGMGAYGAARGFSKIRRNILLGKEIDRTDQPKERLKMMLLVAFGQKKMFQKPLVAFLHLVIYIGFVLINLELLEIILDGVLGTHRILFPILGFAYLYMINTFEVLAFGVILVCAIFLWRRWVLRVKRFHMPEMKGWPVKDASYILWIEIALMTAFLIMNASDQVLQNRGLEHFSMTGPFLISAHLSSLFSGWDNASLLLLERGAWWFHIAGILFFLNYLPYSKHLHILLAFPNTYYASLQAKGQFASMPSVTKEVKIMLGLTQADNNAPADPEKFGAKDVHDLTWKNLMDAYTCTECGRCTAECPANITGKKLSPRKIMMDTRDRLEEVGRNLDALKDAPQATSKDAEKSTQNGAMNYATNDVPKTVLKVKPTTDDGKSLLGDYISDEELWACTTCNACVQACPININPLDIIVQLRQYRVMEQSQAPQSINTMFANMETNAAPWKFAPQDRFNWAQAKPSL